MYQPFSATALLFVILLDLAALKKSLVGCKNLKHTQTLYAHMVSEITALIGHLFMSYFFFFFFKEKKLQFVWYIGDFFSASAFVCI